MLESFRDLLQGITSVGDRLEFSGRGKFCNESRRLQVVDGHAVGGFETDGVGAEGPYAFDEFGDVVGEEAFLGLAAGEADGFGYLREDETVEVGVALRFGELIGMAKEAFDSN